MTEHVIENKWKTDGRLSIEADLFSLNMLPPSVYYEKSQYDYRAEMAERERIKRATSWKDIDLSDMGSKNDY